jgi:hypothetical protein
MGIHLFYYTHGEEKMISNDVVWVAFVSIMKDVNFLVLCEHTHFSLLLAFFFSHQWVNSVVLVDGVQTLVDVVITNFIQTNLVSWTTLCHGVVTTVVIEVKDDLYDD